MLAGVKRKPRYGLTLGFADILASGEILLLVSGSGKAKVLKRTLEGQVTTRFPASLLCLHSNVTLFCDRAAYPSHKRSVQ
jgi:galactosamine-6-phosphate isomerase